LGIIGLHRKNTQKQQYILPVVYICALMSSTTPIKKLAYCAIIIANLFFAINMSTAKYLTHNKLIGPYALNICRVGVALILFWVLALFAKKPTIGIQKKHIVQFIICAIAGVALNQTFFIKGLSLTFATHAALLLLVTPILIAIAAIYFLKERFTAYIIFGLLLGVAGAILLLLQRQNSSLATNPVLGDVLIILNAICYAYYFIAVKPLMQFYKPVHVIRWVFTIGFFMVVPLGWQELQQVHFNQWQTAHWLCLAQVTILGTFCTYLFTIYAIQHLGAAKSGNFIYTQPVFATIIAWLFLNDTMDWQKTLAAALIFFGVFLTHKNK
jgi:drug/metabolite transporter (DMT)-like permease